MKTKRLLTIEGKELDQRQPFTMTVKGRLVKGTR